MKMKNIVTFSSCQIWTLLFLLEVWIRFWRHLLARSHPSLERGHSSSQFLSPRCWNQTGWEKMVFTSHVVVMFFNCRFVFWDHQLNLLCCLWADSRREENSQRRPRQRGNHSDTFRSRKPGRTRQSTRTCFTRLMVNLLPLPGWFWTFLTL